MLLRRSLQSMPQMAVLRTKLSGFMTDDSQRIYEGIVTLLGVYQPETVERQHVSVKSLKVCPLNLPVSMSLP